MQKYHNFFRGFKSTDMLEVHQVSERTKACGALADICNQVINASIPRYSARDIFPIRVKPVLSHIFPPIR
jgi:hypothetical protein